MADTFTGFNRFRRIASRRLGVALARAGLVIERTVKSNSFDALLARRLARVKRDGGEFFFLQIGANDGVSHDPIHAFVTANRLAGIVVEPLPDVFELLCETYRHHPQVRKLNCAIHEELEHVTLYRPDPERVGHMSGIASLNRGRHELTSERSGIQADDIIGVEVPAISLSKLLEQERIDHLDLLQIDTEGYDMQIVAGLDLSVLRPSIIRFEHGVYSGVPARDELREILFKLYDHGYAIAMERVDALAWLHEDVSNKHVRMAVKGSADAAV
jgi:FkbM family methyltransferase